MVRYNKSFYRRLGYNRRRYRPRRYIYKRRPLNIVRRRRPRIQYRGNLAQGMPPVLYMWFKTQSNNLDIQPVAVTGAYSLNLNSMKDPMGTLGSSQPYLFDQLCSATAFYSRYQVYFGSVSIDIINEGADSLRVGICVTPDNATPTTMQEVITQKGGYYKVAGPTGSGMEHIRLYKKWSVKRTLSNFDTNDLQAAAANDPTKRIYLWIFLESVATGSPGNVDAVGQVRLMQRCKLLDVNRQALSVDS